MGIEIEFNPDICLRDYSLFKEGKREEAECLPENIEAGKVYSFLKKGQRMFWFYGELALLETKGNQQLSRPLVITTPSLNILRNLLGIANLFLLSRLYLYSPMNIVIHRYFYKSPTFYHF